MRKSDFKTACGSVTLEQLREGMKVAVRLVDLYGHEYWPVFEWLEREIDDRESRDARLARFR